MYWHLLTLLLSMLLLRTKPPLLTELLWLQHKPGHILYIIFKIHFKMHIICATIVYFAVLVRYAYIYWKVHRSTYYCKTVICGEVKSSLYKLLLSQKQYAQTTSVSGSTIRKSWPCMIWLNILGGRV